MDTSDTLRQLEEAGARRSNERYVLRLFVSGATPKSTRAIANIRHICEEYLDGKYDLEVIDIYQEPEAIRDADIIAIPTLIKHFPLPLRRLIGDLSDLEQVLAGLDIRPEVPGGE